MFSPLSAYVFRISPSITNTNSASLQAFTLHHLSPSAFISQTAKHIMALPILPGLRAGREGLPLGFPRAQLQLPAAPWPVGFVVCESPHSCPVLH